MRICNTGCVCEGGGMRGIYAAGVLDVLGEHGITFDAVVGVSAGAVHATSFVANQHGRSIRLYLAYCQDRHFMGTSSWLKTGNYVNAAFCYDAIPNQLVPLDYDALEKSPTRLFVTATDLITGQPYYHEVNNLRGHEMLALRASASLPMVSKIVDFNGKKLLDGGTADSIPVAFLRKLGFTRTVVILTQAQGYRKRCALNLAFKKIYKNYPNYVHAMALRAARYNKTLDFIQSLEAQNEIIVLRPSKKINIRRLERNPARILEMYELGRQDAINQIKNIQNFLKCD